MIISDLLSTQRYKDHNPYDLTFRNQVGCNTYHFNEEKKTANNSQGLPLSVCSETSKEALLTAEASILKDAGICALQ